MDKIYLTEEEGGENWRGFITLHHHFTNLYKSLINKLSLYNNLIRPSSDDESSSDDLGLSEEKKDVSNIDWANGMKKTILGVKCILFMLNNINTFYKVAKISRKNGTSGLAGVITSKGMKALSSLGSFLGIREEQDNDNSWNTPRFYDDDVEVFVNGGSPEQIKNLINSIDQQYLPIPSFYIKKLQTVALKDHPAPNNKSTKDFAKLLESGQGDKLFVALSKGWEIGKQKIKQAGNILSQTRKYTQEINKLTNKVQDKTDIKAKDLSLLMRYYLLRQRKKQNLPEALKPINFDLELAKEEFSEDEIRTLQSLFNERNEEISKMFSLLSGTKPEKEEIKIEKLEDIHVYEGYKITIDEAEAFANWIKQNKNNLEYETDDGDKQNVLDAATEEDEGDGEIQLQILHGKDNKGMWTIYARQRGGPQFGFNIGFKKNLKLKSEPELKLPTHRASGVEFSSEGSKYTLEWKVFSGLLNHMKSRAFLREVLTDQEYEQLGIKEKFIKRLKIYFDGLAPKLLDAFDDLMARGENKSKTIIYIKKTIVDENPNIKKIESPEVPDKKEDSLNPKDAPSNDGEDDAKAAPEKYTSTTATINLLRTRYQSHITQKGKPGSFRRFNQEYPIFINYLGKIKNQTVQENQRHKDPKKITSDLASTVNAKRDIFQNMMPKDPADKKIIDSFIKIFSGKGKNQKSKNLFKDLWNSIEPVKVNQVSNQPDNQNKMAAENLKKKLIPLIRTAMRGLNGKEKLRY